MKRRYVLAGWISIGYPALLTSAVFLLGALLCTETAWGQTDEFAAADRPNIVLIMADDLGYGDLSSYGHPIIDTPNLDRLAAEGMRLTSFYAQTWCVPSRQALMTGRHPLRIDGGLPSGEITLAEVLSDRGYQTKMVGKWHLGTFEGRLPVNQGFDSWYGLPYSNDMQPPWFMGADGPLRMYRNDEKIPKPIDQDTLTTRYTEEATGFIRSADKDAPLFLYMAYNMVHLPVHTTERFRGQSDGGLYADVVETLDWSAGRIRAALEAEGRADNTIIVFTSDNGPWLDLPDRMLQKGVKSWHQGTVGPLSGSKHSAWEGGLRVPGIVWWPGHIPAGQSSPAPASTMDLLPTLAHAAGAEVPSDRPIDGQNIMPLLQGESVSARQPFFYSNHDELVGVRDETWKLLTKDPGSPPSPDALPALYRLSRDPGERYNMADEHPEVVRRLKRQMEHFLQTLEEPPPGASE
jgi:arylsulfatase A-like enzyme